MITSKKYYYFVPLLVIFCYILLFLVLSSSTSPMSLDHIIPYQSGQGRDYSSVHGYVQALLSGESPYTIVGNGNIYPPFVTLFNVIWSCFPFLVSYKILIVILAITNMIIVYLFVKISESQMIAISISDRPFWVVTFIAMQFISYGFLFSIERGNYDVFPLFFMVLSVIFLQKDRSWINLFLSSLFLTAAIHLKVYPLIIIPLVLYKYKWRGLVVIFLVNILFLFSLGFANAVLFLNNLLFITTDRAAAYLWVGNHSALSYSNYICSELGRERKIRLIVSFLGFDVKVIKRIVELVTLYLPILLWLYINVKAFLAKRDFILNYFISSIFLMCFIPTLSHDYKLVLMIIPLIYSFMRVSDLLVSKLNFVNIITAILVAVAYINIVLPYNVPVVFRNKYPAMLLLMFITGFLMLKPLHNTTRDSIHE